MRALVYDGPGRKQWKEVPDPRLIDETDAIIGVDTTTICGTDLHILANPPNHPSTPGSILGHEYVARVLDCGRAVKNLQKDDRVVVDPNITCGECDPCRLGRTNMCKNMTTLGIYRHGGLALYNVAPARALYKVAPGMPPERAVLAEPLSCIYAGYEKAPPQPGASWSQGRRPGRPQLDAPS